MKNRLSFLPGALWLVFALTPFVFTASAQEAPAPDAEAELLRKAEQEQIKRMETSLSLATSLDEAGQLVRAGDYTKARVRYNSILEQTTANGAFADINARAKKELAALSALQAREAEKGKRYDQARALWQEASTLDPANPAYAAGLRSVDQKDPPLSRRYPGNTAATPELLDKVTRIQKLLFEGDSFHESGQYQRAISRYKEILTIDPYHKVARQRIERTEKAKYRAATIRLDARREKALAEVDEAIATRPVARKTAPAEITTNESTRTNVAGVFDKLESIIIPELNFNEVDVADAVRFLNEQSRALDPERKGINFVLKVNPTSPATPAEGEAAPPPSVQRTLTLNLRQVPLIEVLRFITNLTNLQFKVEEYAVFIFPSTETSDVQVVRSFSVPPNFFTVTPRATGEVGATGAATVEFVTADVKSELEQKGVKFPAGSSAAYLPRSAKLIVRNTLDQINLIAQLLAEVSDATTQIEIETKFIEFTQDKLTDFSFNYRLNSNRIIPAPLGNLIDGDYLNNVGNADDVQPVRAESNLRASGNLPNNSIDALLGLGGNRTANTLSFGAILGGNGASLLISALESAVGADLMSAPKVTVVNGQEATICIVRELRYPTEYEAPEIVNSAQGSSGNVGVASFTVVPSNPTDFETRDVGVILKVKADATKDRRIDLDLKPEVTEFQGFINYGGAVREATDPANLDPVTGEGLLRVQGIALTPVFSLRQVTTKLQVVDGQTVVMGGFIRDDTQKVEDKIPLLGDLPLIGRAFRSKADRTIKRNLVIFTTARIVNPDGTPKFLTASEVDAMETLGNEE